MNHSETKEFISETSLETKVLWSLERIKEFYDYNKGEVFVSFSGGKDSTVLLHLVRRLYPDVPGVFFNTGVEFPETVEFVNRTPKTISFRPKKTFKAIIEEHGIPYPSKPIAGMLHKARTTKNRKAFESALSKIPEKYKHLLLSNQKFSDKCCNYLKMEISNRINKITGKFPFVGCRAMEGRIRFNTYVATGCNIESRSWPMALWSDNDVTKYVDENNIELSPVYSMGYTRTGCVYCMFGVDLEEEPRFKKLKTTHPKLWEYAMTTLGYKKVCDELGVIYE